MSTLLKKPKKKKTQAQLLAKYEQKMKPIIIYRDMERCQIAGYRHICGGSLRMDHRPMKRGKHATFFDPRNLTTVCGTANYMAELDPLVSLAIMQVVEKREGIGTIKRLEKAARAEKRWYEEDIIDWITKCAAYFLANTKGMPRPLTQKRGWRG